MLSRLDLFSVCRYGVLIGLFAVLRTASGEQAAEVSSGTVGRTADPSTATIPWDGPFASPSEEEEKQTTEPLRLRALRAGRGIRQPVDEERARQLFLRAAEKKEPLASMYLALLRYHGTYGVGLDREGARRDARRGISDLKRRAERREPEACFLLGSLLEDGLGADENSTEAARLMRVAAEMDWIPAIERLGRYFQFGTGVPTDEEEALKWYRRGASAGSAAALRSLGLVYLEKEKDPEFAVRVLRFAAESGDPEAMHWLGHAYEDGLGVGTDEKQALDWFRKAAEAGSGSAMTDVGRAY